MLVTRNTNHKVMVDCCSLLPASLANKAQRGMRQVWQSADCRRHRDLNRAFAGTRSRGEAEPQGLLRDGGGAAVARRLSRLRLAARRAPRASRSARSEPCPLERDDTSQTNGGARADPTASSLPGRIGASTVPPPRTPSPPEYRPDAHQDRTSRAPCSDP